MRVSDERLMRQCAIADARLATNAGLNGIDEYALDLRDARARIAKLESIIKTLHEELKDRANDRGDDGGYDPSGEWFDRLEELMEEKGVQL